MKTAICFACTGRSIEHTFENLKKFVIDDLDERDLIIYLTEGEYTKNALKYFEGIKNCHIFVEKEEPIQIDNFIFHPDFPPVDKDLGRDQEKGRQIFFQMIRSRSRLGNLLKNMKKQYERVIFSRMDVVYQEPISKQIENLDLSKIWIPCFHNWLDGYNDRFAVSSMENMIDYFSLYDSMEKYRQQGMIVHAERVLRHHLDTLKKDIKFFKIYFARIRPNGFLHDNFDIIKQQAVRE